jgi:hypothetical protein
VQDPDPTREYVRAGAGQSADARSDSAKAQAAPGETGRGSGAAGPGIAAEVSNSAAGTVVVHTSQATGTPVKYGEEAATAPRAGFYSFGDGVDRATTQTSRELRDARAGAAPKMYEGVTFIPVTEPTYRTEEYVEKSRRFGNDVIGQRSVRDGTKPVMVDGPHARVAEADRSVARYRRPGLRGPAKPPVRPFVKSHMRVVGCRCPAPGVFTA